jgi:hypothetical protein
LIGYILHRNRLLKHERKDRRIEVKERIGRRRKLIVDELKEMTVYWNLKEKFLDHILWRTGFGRGSKPIFRQTAE